MKFTPHTHWRHKYADVEAWIELKKGTEHVVNLKVGRNEFAQVKTHQIDRLLKDFDIAPLDMGD